MLIIQKFGGTSVGTSERLLQVSEIIKSFFQQNHQIIVVVSAMNPIDKAAGTTNNLLKSAEEAIEGKDFKSTLKSIEAFHENVIIHSIKNSQQEKNLCLDFLKKSFFSLEKFLDALSIIQEISNRASDEIIKIGEQLCAFILSSLLRDQNLKSEFFDLSNIILTPQEENFEKLNEDFYKALKENLYRKFSRILKNKNIIPIATGFIGQFPHGIIKNIGRGYTDYTAALLGSVMKSDEIQIWKEVNGMFTSNPKIVKNAKLLNSLSISEAFELSFIESEVIHPLCMHNINQSNIPIRIKNTFHPKNEGTLITKENKGKNLPIVRGIALKKNVTIINIQSDETVDNFDFKSKILKIFENHQILINMITTSKINISISIEESYELNDKISKQLSAFGSISFYKGRSIIGLVGENLKKDKSIHTKIFQCLTENGIEIEMISQSVSQINISCVIKNSDSIKAIHLLHEKLIEQAN